MYTRQKNKAKTKLIKIVMSYRTRRAKHTKRTGRAESLIEARFDGEAGKRFRKGRIGSHFESALLMWLPHVCCQRHQLQSPAKGLEM